MTLLPLTLFGNIATIRKKTRGITSVPIFRNKRVVHPPLSYLPPSQQRTHSPKKGLRAIYWPGRMFVGQSRTLVYGRNTRRGKRHNAPDVGNDVLVIGNGSSPGIRLQQAVWGVVVMTLCLYAPPAPPLHIALEFPTEAKTETQEKTSRHFAINGPRGTTIPCGLTSLPGGPTICRCDATTDYGVSSNR